MSPAPPPAHTIDPAAVRAVVFDLGNVLYRLDNHLYDGSWPLGIGADHEDFEAWVAGEGLYYAFETGQVAREDFVSRLSKRLGLTPKQVLDYWNSLLLDFVPGFEAGLQVLRKRYRLFLLSNTNAAHIEYVTAQAQRSGLGDWRRHFEHAFTSYQLSSVKPEPEIYNRARGQIGLPAEQLLFVDDRMENVEAARALGWQAMHLVPGEDVFERLASIGI